MIRVVVPLAMLLPFGCGGMEATSLPDASSTAADAASDATHTADATSDGPPVYCWEMCGAISGPDAAPPDAWVFECPVGQICGETGGVAGWRCCSGVQCTPGTQHGYGCP